MARLAEAVGVSRQTVYNEIGTKNALAEAMILAELDAVPQPWSTAAFDAHPDDLVRAIETARTDVLTYAQDNDLLHAVVTATHGADTELLPLLTTHSGPCSRRVKDGRRQRGSTAYAAAMTPEQLERAIDMVVRVVLSHVMQPSATPAADRGRPRLARRRVLEG